MAVTITADPSTRTVAELFAGIGDGDPTAWPELVRRYSDLVMNRARRYQMQESDRLDACLLYTSPSPRDS